MADKANPEATLQNISSFVPIRKSTSKFRYQRYIPKWGPEHIPTRSPGPVSQTKTCFNSAFPTTPIPDRSTHFIGTYNGTPRKDATQKETTWIAQPHTSTWTQQRRIDAEMDGPATREVIIKNNPIAQLRTLRQFNTARR